MILVEADRMKAAAGSMRATARQQAVRCARVRHWHPLGLGRVADDSDVIAVSSQVLGAPRRANWQFALHPPELLSRYASYTPFGTVHTIWATLTDQNSITGGWNESMGT